MPPESILSETAGNYAMESSQVHSIKIKRGREKNSHELRIKWSGGTAAFQFTGMSPTQVREFLSLLFGHAVK